MEEISTKFKPIQSIPRPIAEGNKIAPTTDAKKGEAFSEVLTKAIGEVESLQQEADKKVAGLVTGTGNVTPHDAMLALEKADIAFNLMTQIRSKIVRAYEEVMRTQV
jgi:flagellar hook-basal body complex protein FliE